MALKNRYSFAWMVGSWLVTLDIGKPEPAIIVTSTHGEDYMDWDVLAGQYGIPINMEGTGLQLCAECRRSVAPGSRKFANRVPLGDYASRMERGYRYPAGAFLCAECNSKRGRVRGEV
ncbi:hypothetical protein FJY94_04620 [Candidatus Kaiserbacteria bacterium]|nr:hypothetical protein [Candidatus Kaiserbacteria bacterium]